MFIVLALYSQTHIHSLRKKNTAKSRKKLDGMFKKDIHELMKFKWNAEIYSADQTRRAETTIALQLLDDDKRIQLKNATTEEQKKKIADSFATRQARIEIGNREWYLRAKKEISDKYEARKAALVTLYRGDMGK